MTIEQNERSAAYGFFVCKTPASQGGCYDGPYPYGADGPSDTRPDDLSDDPRLLVQ